MELVVSDAHEGLRRAIEEVFPEALWQRYATTCTGCATPPITWTERPASRPGSPQDLHDNR